VRPLRVRRIEGERCDARAHGAGVARLHGYNDSGKHPLDDPGVQEGGFGSEPVDRQPAAGPDPRVADSAVGRDGDVGGVAAAGRRPRGASPPPPSLAGDVVKRIVRASPEAFTNVPMY
jgi:hypothetical protein